MEQDLENSDFDSKTEQEVEKSEEKAQAKIMAGPSERQKECRECNKAAYRKFS